MREKRLFYNTISSLVFQVTTIICGFILPRLILNAFGSEVNGLVNSITQFLGVISFLELGVGAVVQSALYKPLAEKNQEDVSKIISSANKFFTRLGQILLIYVIVLVIFYPQFAGKNFGFIYTASLIVTISISSFAQYFFGIVNRLLLTADQRGYIQYNAQTLAVVCNTAACFILIRVGCSIQIVKLTTSLIYLLQPFLIYLYVRHHYSIDKKIKYTKEPIPQKWNGIAQHVAAVILDGTDTIVLTLFATLSDVSIYSVYFLVVKGVKQLFMSMTNGITSAVVRLIGLILGYMCSYMGVIFVYYTVKMITEKLINAKKSKLWNGFKKRSFGIYLFHQQIIYLTIIPLNGKVPPIVQVMISFLCAVGVASIITAVLKRFKLTRILYGV